LTLIDFFRLTRHNLGLLVVASLLGLLGGTVFSLLQPTVYTAEASGYVAAGQSESVGSASTALTLAGAKAASYVPLVNSKRVLEGIQTDLAGKYPQGVTVIGLAAQATQGTPLYNVTAQAATAVQARDVAAAAVRATAAEALRLESMGPDGKSTGQSVVRLVPQDDASLPARPTSPNWTRNLPVGAGVGLALGYALAFVRRGIDNRVRTQEDMDEMTGASVLGIIPKAEELAAGKGTSRSVDRGMTAEAIRQLRTNLRFVSVDDPPRTIVMTSANPGEGKSTVAANLARVLAQSGQEVVLVDADLRRPTQGSRFGIDNGVGLTQVLAGDVPLADALQETGVPQLLLLPAGRIPPNPSELVGSQRMRQVIDALASDRLVIIDAPPLLPVTDAGLLTAAADGAILVIRVGKTPKEHVRQCLRLLNNVNGHLLGSVLNMTPLRAMGTAMYGYGYGGYGASSYGSEYAPSEDPAPAPKRTKSRARRRAA
jgi:polysaccharide biosynthesis transport protein